MPATMLRLAPPKRARNGPVCRAAVQERTGSSQRTSASTNIWHSATQSALETNEKWAWQAIGSRKGYSINDDCPRPAVRNVESRSNGAGARCAIALCSSSENGTIALFHHGPGSDPRRCPGPTNDIDLIVDLAGAFRNEDQLTWTAAARKGFKYGPRMTTSSAKCGSARSMSISCRMMNRFGVTLAIAQYAKGTSRRLRDSPTH